MKPPTVSREYRDNGDGKDWFLVLVEKNGAERVIEWDFLLDALALRATDVQAYEFVWSLVDLLAERTPPLDGSES